MKLTTKTIVLAVIVALGAAPAMALPPQVPANNGTQHATGNGPSKTNPGPHASLPAKAKAYGRYCQGFSKKHVAGTKGTPFSRCVTAMAKLGGNRTDSPRQACQGFSKKHVAGTRGTPFSRCVSAGAKLLNDKEEAGS